MLSQILQPHIWPVSLGGKHGPCGGHMPFSECPLCRCLLAPGSLLLLICSSQFCSKGQRHEGAGPAPPSGKP